MVKGATAEGVKRRPRETRRRIGELNAAQVKAEQDSVGEAIATCCAKVNVPSESAPLRMTGPLSQPSTSTAFSQHRSDITPLLSHTMIQPTTLHSTYAFYSLQSPSHQLTGYEATTSYHIHASRSELICPHEGIATIPWRRFHISPGPNQTPIVQGNRSKSIES